MTKKIKTGVVGLGEWGPKLARNLSSIEDSKLTALADTNPKALESIAKIYSNIPQYLSLEEMLDKEKLDALIISTPANLHYAHIITALEKEIHVFAEKPLALSLKDAEKCFELAHKKNLTLMSGHTFIFNPAVNWIKNYIQSSDFGRIYYVSAQRLSLGRIREDINVLWNLAPHDFSILLYLLDEMPNKISAHGAKLLNASQEDVVVVTMEYDSQRIANIELCWLNPQKIRKMTFVAEKGMIVYDDVSQDRKITYYDKQVNVIPQFLDSEGSFKKFQLQIKSGKEYVPEIKFDEPLKIELEHFLSCIQSGKEPITGKEHTLNVIKMLEAAQNSIEQNGLKIKL